MDTHLDISPLVERSLLARNAIMADFFGREAGRLASACQEMSERFLKGGRLLAFGRGPYATDAQHVAVEFVHPVIVGKRALPALDISPQFRPWLEALVRPEDMVMGFGPPEGDREVWAALDSARRQGAMTFALPGGDGSYAASPLTTDPFIHQELIEVLYHTLWESVHVFFEHRELGQDVGASGFLYPFLGHDKQNGDDVLVEVERSILMKVEDDATLRETMASSQDEIIGQAAIAMAERVARGGKLLLMGNGGSATDANDWAIDCVMPPGGYRPLPAVSLSLEPASITAIANDVGIGLVFLRQIAAHARQEDVAVAISTSGGSRNLISALAEARTRGLLTVALVGHDGGAILRESLADFIIAVPSDQIPRVQEIHASVYHVIRQVMDRIE